MARRSSRLTAALTTYANHVDTLHLLGLLSLQAEQYDAAVEWIPAPSDGPDPEFLTDLGNILLKQGRNTEAVDVFDKVVQLNPTTQDFGEDLETPWSKPVVRPRASIAFSMHSAWIRKTAATWENADFSSTPLDGLKKPFRISSCAMKCAPALPRRCFFLADAW